MGAVSQAETVCHRQSTHLPNESEVLLLHAQQLAGCLRHHGTVPWQVVQYGLPEGGSHSQVAQGDGALQVNNTKRDSVRRSQYYLGA